MFIFFYNSFAKSINFHGILTYGSAAETTFKKLRRPNEEYYAHFVFKNKYDSVAYMFEQNEVLIVFEAYVMELFGEVFEKLRKEFPLHLPTGDDKCSFYTRRSQQRLLTNTYNRTVTTSKSVENWLRKAYNWLKERDLIHEDIRTLSNSQITVQLRKISELYVIGSNVSTSTFNKFFKIFLWLFQTSVYLFGW